MRFSQVDAELVKPEEGSSFAMSMPTPEDPRLVCGENNVRAYVSARRDAAIRASHYLVSGANIFRARTEPVDLSGNDLEAEYVGDALIIDSGLTLGQREEDVVLTAYDVAVDRPMMEEEEDGGELFRTVRVVLAMDDESTTITASRVYSADSCAKRPEATFSSSQLRPGDEVSLEVSGGRPGSLCGYSAIDKSLDLLPNFNKVTAPKVQQLRERQSYARRDYEFKARYNCHGPTDSYGPKRMVGGDVVLDLDADLAVVSNLNGRCHNLQDVTERADQLDFPVKNRRRPIEPAFASDFDSPVQLQSFSASSGGSRRPPPAPRPVAQAAPVSFSEAAPQAGEIRALIF